MSFKVTLDNGMYGTIDHDTYDIVLSTVFGASSGLIACLLYGKTLTNLKNYFFPKTNNKLINYSKVPKYKLLEEYMDNLSEDELPSDLGERMKLYETFTEYNVNDIDSKTGFVIRVDGRTFSNILKQLKQQEIEELNTPFISDFVEAMQLTTRDLVKEFNASTGYTHSDEISLYFKPLNTENDEEQYMKEHIFGGRVHKLISLISSYATSRLIKNLTEVNHEKFDSILERISFDARAIIFPSTYEVCNYFLWLSKKDCYRNFVSELCHCHFPKKSLDKLNVDERIVKLQNEKKININDYNIFLRRGTFVKRQLEHYKENETNFWRNVYVKFTLPNLKCSNNYNELIECKNFEEWEFTDIEYEKLNNF